MATGTLDDMTIFNQQYYGGFMNRVQTQLDIFNQTSLGAFNLSALFHEGFTSQEAFFTNTVTIKDRDPSSNATIVPDNVGSDSIKKVKLFKYIYGGQSLQSFRNQGLGMDEIAFQMGVHAGDQTILEWREGSVAATAGIFDIPTINGGTDNLVLDISGEAGGGVFTVNTMIRAMPLFGDANSRLKIVVMHSDVYWPMVAAASTNLATPATADFAVQSGMPATMGKPILVVDSPALVIPNGGGVGINAYRTLILTEGAISTEESEMPFTGTDTDLSKENSVITFKTELAYSVGVKGVSWIGADKPGRADLAVAANWEKKYASKRDLPGIQVISVATANL